MADTDRPTIAAPSVLEMARECGIEFWQGVTPPGPWSPPPRASITADQLTAFAERIRADEREKCALLCDDIEASSYAAYRPSGTLAARDCAARIRARGAGIP